MPATPSSGRGSPNFRRPESPSPADASHGEARLDFRRPAYLILGDPYLADAQFENLFRALRAAVKGEFFQQTFRVPDAALDSVLAQARTLPFLASFQIFRVFGAETLKEKALESLERYLQAPPDAACLIFQAETLEKSDTLAELIGPKCILKVEASEKKGAASKLLREKARKAGKNFAPGALERLEDQAGDAPAFLDSILDQLILYAGGSGEITEDMVEAFEEDWTEPNAFALTDAIAARNTAGALKVFEQIAASGDREFISLLGLLHWQIRRLWLASVLQQEGTPQAEIMRKCKISGRQAPYFWRQVQGFKREKLEEMLEGLFQLDWKLKTGQAEAMPAAEAWIVRSTSKI